MKNKDNNFCSGKEMPEQIVCDSFNPYCKETMPTEYYKYERGFKNGVRNCICTNQEFVTECFCENCNAYIY